MTHPDDPKDERTPAKPGDIKASATIRALYTAPVSPTQPRSYRTTARALAANELWELLHGQKGYYYQDMASAPVGATDVSTIYYRICEYAKDHPELDMKGTIEQLIPHLAKTELGRVTVALMLSTEHRSQRSGQSSLGLDVEKLRGWTPYGLAAAAVRNDALLQLLLSEKPYCYFPEWSGEATSLDFYDIYQQGLYEYAQDHPEQDIKSRVEAVLPLLCTTEFGRARLRLIMRMEDEDFYSPKYPSLILYLDFSRDETVRALVPEDVWANLQKRDQRRLRHLSD